MTNDGCISKLSNFAKENPGILHVIYERCPHEFGLQDSCTLCADNSLGCCNCWEYALYCKENNK